MPKNPVYTSYDDEGFPATAAFTASVTIAGGAVKASAGRLMRINVTTAFAGSSGVLAFYDNATAGSGTILAVIPLASGTIGALYNVNLPAVNGIYAAVLSGTFSAGAVTVGYS